MKTIYKFKLPNRGINYLSMPTDSHVLHVDEQYGELTLWAMCDTSKSYSDSMEIHVYGTGGYDIPETITHLNYIGTVLMQEGLVWHVFKKI